MTAQDLLREAALMIERDGWCSYRSRGPDNQRCMIMALGDTFRAEYDLALHTLKVLLQLPDIGDLAYWNDKVAETADEVTGKLREAARRLDEAEAEAVRASEEPRETVWA